MRFSDLIKEYDTLNVPSQYVQLFDGDFLALKPVDESKAFDGCMYFELYVFRRKTKDVFCLWVRTDELLIECPVAFRVFQDKVDYFVITRTCELQQKKTVRLI